MQIKKLKRAVWSALLGITLASAAQAQTQFGKLVVFGDSLSDDGNFAHRTRDAVGFSYPSSNPEFNYSDYRFTNDFNTDPPTRLYHGVWHEQLAQSFLHLSVATNSLDGGTDFAFGGATTKDGTQDVTIIDNPLPFAGGNLTITIDNLRQHTWLTTAGTFTLPGLSLSFSHSGC